jgi:hypothetical protein
MNRLDLAILSKGLRWVSLAGAFAAPAIAQAGWPEFKQECHTDKLRNNAWPQPFRAMDSNAVAAPFEVMKCNGWREFNTLSHAFFDGSNQLTESGELKLKQVVIQSPPNRRAVYVLKGSTPEQTAVRVEAVEVAVSSILPVGDLPPIFVTDIEPSTSSGAYQTIVNRALIRTTPSPRLPTMTDMNTAPTATIAPNANQSSNATGGK